MKNSSSTESKNSWQRVKCFRIKGTEIRGDFFYYKKMKTNTRNKIE